VAPAGTWTDEECRKPVGADGLRGELIGLAGNDPLGEIMVAACEAQDVQPLFHTVVQTYQIARSLVEAGAGTAVLDPFTAASGDRAKVQCRRWAPPIPVHLYLLTAAHAPLSHGARELANCIGATARASLEPTTP
jgi:hypothetical protein